MPSDRATCRGKGLLVALLLTILVGAAAASAFVRVDIGSPEPVVVPPLNDGTRGTYVLFNDEETIGTLAIEIQAADPLVTRDGAYHEGYRLRTNATLGQEEWHHVEWVLPTGVMQRHDVAQFRHGFEEVRAVYAIGEPILPHLEVAGTALEEGTHPLHEDGLWSWWSVEDDVGVLHRIACQAERSKVIPGLIDGVEAHGVQTSLDCDGTEQERTTWFTAHQAVPAAITYQRPGETPVLLALVSTVAGDGVPLTGDAVETAAAPQVAHGPDAHPHPVSGDLAQLDYPIELAIEDVRGPAGSALFRLWSARHPDADLVGARLMRGEHHARESATDQWRLLFATPDGVGYVVNAERPRSGTGLWVTEGGESPVDRSTGGSFPYRLVTLASAVQRWAHTAGPDHQGAEADFIQWGLDVPLTWSDDCGFIPPHTALLPIESRFDRIVAGHSTYGSCIDPKIVRSESYVVFDAASGEALGLIEHRVELAAFPSGEVSRAGPSSVVITSSAISFRPPQVEPWGVVAVPLLIVIWTVYFWPQLKMGLIWGYSRVLPSDVPDHPVRAQILDLIRQDQGITASELTKRLGIGWGAFAHHVAVLERTGHLRSHVVGRHRHLFTDSFARQGPVQALALLRHATAKRAFNCIATEPGLSQQELAERLGMTPAGALWHARRLEEAGLVRRERRGRSIAYHPKNGRS